jgi:hypothetical protein
MGEHETMQRAENEALGRLNTIQAEEGKRLAKIDELEDEVSLALNEIIDNTKSWGVDLPEACMMIEKIVREIKKFNGVGK